MNTTAIIGSAMIALGASAFCAGNAGCGQGAPRADVPAATAPMATDVAVTVAAQTAGDAVVRHVSKGRVAAIGDLHGDLDATRTALKLAGALGDDDRWAGDDLFVVQLGDQLDRGDGEPEILALLDRLAVEAKAVGGAVIVLNGNHEYMNAIGDLRYVTPDGMADWGGADKRLAAFSPGGPEAIRLASRPHYAIVDDTLFAHAGVLPAHVEAGLEATDQAIRAWLRGETKVAPAFLKDPESAVWTRRYGRAPTAADCEAASLVLKRLDLKRMVVGHSPQPHINAVCDATVWRADVGMARHYGGPVEVLMLEGGKARVITATP